MQPTRGSVDGVPLAAKPVRPRPGGTAAPVEASSADAVATRAAQSSQRRLAAIVGSAADGIATVAPDGIVLTCGNPRARPAPTGGTPLRHLLVEGVERGGEQDGGQEQQRPDHEIDGVPESTGKASVPRVMKTERSRPSVFHRAPGFTPSQPIGSAGADVSPLAR